ncbi:peptide ABC transporter substrate-binding protein [Bacillus luti]|nr:peptide ABC transporter substrate-binding protein [Bacillus cereus]
MKNKFVKIPFLVLTASVVLVACGGKDTDTAVSKEDSKKVKLADKQVIKLLETSEIPSMDSSLATDSVSLMVMNNAMEGLYRLDKKNKPIPGIAKSVDISDDKLTYTFHLRDAKWSNGEPIKAQDFEYSWKRGINPDTAAQYAFIMYDVKNAEKINKKQESADKLGVHAKDDKTLVVELERPTDAFLSKMAFATFYPLNEEFVKSQGAQHGLEANTTLYNGPFKMTEWKHEEGWVLKKNPNYWDKDNVKLEELDFSVIKNVGTAVNLYTTEMSDRAILSAEFVDKYKNDPGFKTQAEPSLFFLRLNQNNAVLKNEKVRKAMNSVIDKDAMVNVLMNNGSVAADYFVPKKFVSDKDGKDFRETNGNLVKYDVANGKKLWGEAKKELGKSKVTLELLNYDSETSKKVGEYIKDQLEKNLDGLTVQIKQQPFAQKLELEKAQDYDISLAGWSPDYLDAISFMDIFVSGSPYNQMNYSNKEYDKLVKNAVSELDSKKRWEMLLDAEKILLKEDASIVPLYQRGTSMLLRENIKDVMYHPIGGNYSYKWAYVTK